MHLLWWQWTTGAVEFLVAYLAISLPLRKREERKFAGKLVRERDAELLLAQSESAKAEAEAEVSRTQKAMLETQKQVQELQRRHDNFAAKVQPTPKVVPTAIERKGKLLAHTGTCNCGEPTYDNLQLCGACGNRLKGLMCSTTGKKYVDCRCVNCTATRKGLKEYVIEEWGVGIVSVVDRTKSMWIEHGGPGRPRS